MTTAQKTDTAYRMNLAGFEKLIRQCEALGKNYKPSGTKLKLTALNKLKEQVLQGIKENREQTIEYLKASGERSTLDRETQRRAKLILKAIPPPPRPTQAEMEALRKMPREEWAKRERPKPPPFLEEIQRLRSFSRVKHAAVQSTSAGNTTTTEENASRLTHREWYKIQADALADLAGKLKTLEAYTPEPDATPEALQTLSHDMQQKNEAVNAAVEVKKQADGKLHALFYDTENGLMAIAGQVKAHILETTEPGSDIHRLVSVIMFHNPTSAT